MTPKKSSDHRDSPSFEGQSNPSPKVSVVVPVMNNGETLPETLRSILSQSYQNLEIIIFDDFSSDESVRAAQEFLSDPRVRLVRSEKRLGIPGSWSEASRLATGSFIKLVCADDLIDQDMIEAQVRLLGQASAEVGFVSSNRRLVGPSSKKLFEIPSALPTSRPVSYERDLPRIILSGTSPFGEPMCVLFRAEVLREIDYWDSPFELCVDLHAFLRALKLVSGKHENCSRASFRIRPGQHSKQRIRALVDNHRRLYQSLVSDGSVSVGPLLLPLGVLSAMLRVFLKIGLRKFVAKD